MTQICRVLPIAAAAALFSLGASTLSAAEWDLPLAWPDGNFHVENAKMFAAEVEKATEGRVKINIHPGGSLGFKGPEMLTAVRDGLVPIGDILLNQQVGEAPIVGIEAQPYVVSGFDQLRQLHKHFRPVLDEVAARFNQKVLYLVPWPRQYVYTKVPISKLDDLAGIKIRTYNKTTTALFNAVGMTAVQLPWGEVVPSLAAGTIDAVTTSASSGVDGKFWEFLKFMYPTSHVWGSNMVNVNLDAWAAIDEKDRAAIEATAQRLEPQFWDVSRMEDEAKSRILNDNGVAMGTVMPEMLKGMQDATQPMVAEFMQNYPKAKEVLESFFAAIGR
ncbi:MAG: TRAP transporter substrate-binding protein [Alphaproteobacteria bacterium]|nr:TRAP transporter substrate-binding protein [Alphaproteobacteria bacterium]